MSTVDGLVIRPFERGDTEQARRVLGAGFREHFGDAYDETKDPDLDHLEVMLSDGVFLVAVLDGELVGTGGMIVVGDGAAELRRMSTKSAFRRQGVASALLAELLAEAGRRGCRRVIL